MPVYPSLQSLEIQLFDYLSNNSEVNDLADVSSVHPDRTFEDGESGRVVIRTITDEIVGEILSRSYIEPQIQISCWDIDYPRSRRLEEKVMEVMEAWTSNDFQMANQKLILTTLRSRNVGFYSKTSLFVSELIYSFSLSLK